MNELHLALMLWLREQTKKYNQFSATKQKQINELQKAGLVKIDAEDFVFNSEQGDAVLTLTINEFDRLTKLVNK